MVDEDEAGPCLPGLESAAARWRDQGRSQKWRILHFLRCHLGQAVCMHKQRAELGVENVRGRISDLCEDGYAIEGAARLPLCDEHHAQLYRLTALAPGDPRIKEHGGVWSRDNWNGLSVRLHGAPDSLLRPAELEHIRESIQDAIVQAEARVAAGSLDLPRVYEDLLAAVRVLRNLSDGWDHLEASLLQKVTPGGDPRSG